MVAESEAMKRDVIRGTLGGLAVGLWMNVFATVIFLGAGGLRGVLKYADLYLFYFAEGALAGLLIGLVKRRVHGPLSAAGAGAGIAGVLLVPLGILGFGAPWTWDARTWASGLRPDLVFGLGGGLWWWYMGRDLLTQWKERLVPRHLDLRETVDLHSRPSMGRRVARGAMAGLAISVTFDLIAVAFWLLSQPPHEPALTLVLLMYTLGGIGGGGLVGAARPLVRNAGAAAILGFMVALYAYGVVAVLLSGWPTHWTRFQWLGALAPALGVGPVLGAWFWTTRRRWQGLL